MRTIELHLRLASVVCLSLILLRAAPARAATVTQTLEFPRASVDVVRAPAGDKIVIRDATRVTYTTDSGLPEIPYRIVSILLPAGETVADFGYEEDTPVRIAEDVRVALVPDAVATDGTRPRADASVAWSADAAIFPNQRAVYLGTGTLHGHAIASFAVFPVRLVNGSVELAERATLRVETAPDPAAATVVQRARQRDGFREDVAERLATLVENPRDAVSYLATERRVAQPRGGFQPTAVPSLEGSPVDYVIVTDDSLAASYPVLADWKTSQRVRDGGAHHRMDRSKLSATESDIAETIRTFIKDAYPHWGTKYVLFGGDVGI